MLDPSSDKAILPLEFFRLKIQESESPVSRANMQRAVDALAAFVGGAPLTFASFTPEFLGEFTIRLIFRGSAPKTISNNILKRLATLYNKAVAQGLADSTDAFRTLKEKLDRYQLPEPSYTADTDVVGKLHNVIRTDHTTSPRRQLAKDILLYAIYNGGLTFEQVAATRKTDYTGSDPAITAIVDRYSKPKNKYLFPLNQAHSTPRQLSRTIQLLVSEILGPVRLPLSSVPSHTPAALWCAVALSCGVSASDVAAILPAGKLPSFITTFARPSAISEDRAGEICSDINVTLSSNPLHWYVMQFRPRVSYDMVRDRLSDCDIHLAETYYPMEEVTRKIGGKKVFESRPVISWLLFFRSHATDLYHLYHEIGDLAWGYRTAKTVGSPYAIISPAEIRRYQIAIGDLTEDTELYPEGTIQLQPGDQLLILGGLFSGRPATFDSVKKTDTDGGRTICRILLDGGHYKDWIIEEDVRLLKKITETEYHSLSQAL